MAICQVCGKQIKLRKGLVVDHGHARRGTRLGRCLGSGFPPAEEDDTALRLYISILQARMEAASYHGEDTREIEEELAEAQTRLSGFER